MHAKNSGFSSEVRQDCCVCSSSDMSLPVNTTMCFALPSTDWKLRSIEGSTLCMCACRHAFCEVHQIDYGKLQRSRACIGARSLCSRLYMYHRRFHLVPDRSHLGLGSQLLLQLLVPANRTPTVVAVVPIYGWRYGCHLSLQRTQVDGPQLLVPACSEQPSDRFESQVAPAQSLFASAYSLSSKATVSACTEEGTAVRQTQDEVLKSTTNCLLPRVSLFPGT